MYLVMKGITDFSISQEYFEGVTHLPISREKTYILKGWEQSSDISFFASCPALDFGIKDVTCSLQIFSQEITIIELQDKQVNFASLRKYQKEMSYNQRKQEAKLVKFCIKHTLIHC